MWELDSEEGWALKNWWFWTVVLEKTLESPLDCKEIQPVYSEGDQPWDFFGEKDAEAETPVLCPPHVKSWLIGKVSDSGRYWGQEEKGTTEDEIARWHHWLDGRESEWTPGVGDGQGGLVWCDSWGRKESDKTERLIWSDQMEMRNTLLETGENRVLIKWQRTLLNCLLVCFLTHWKRPWCCDRVKAGEGDGRGWDGWMASLTWWTWVWASSRSWWWTGKPGVTESATTELNWMCYAN